LKNEEVIKLLSDIEYRKNIRDEGNQGTSGTTFSSRGKQQRRQALWAGSKVDLSNLKVFGSRA